MAELIEDQCWHNNDKHQPPGVCDRVGDETSIRYARSEKAAARGTKIKPRLRFLWRSDSQGTGPL